MFLRITLAVLVLVSWVQAQGLHDNAAAQKAITMAKERLARDGARFGPLHVKVTTDLVYIYHGFPHAKGGTGRSSDGVVFYRVRGEAGDAKSTGVFLPLGDTAILPSASNAKYPKSLEIKFGGPGWKEGYANRIGALLVKADKSAPYAVAHPTGFNWKGDDKGSGNDRNLSYWEPVPPPEYVALGWCFTNGEKPDASKYWVVHRDFVVDADSEAYFEDKGYQFEHHDLDLYEIKFRSAATHGQNELLMIPTTYVGPGAKSSTFALKLEKAFLELDSTDSEPQWWVGLKSPHVGATTKPGLRKIAVLPFTAMDDNSLRFQAKHSPWYFVASEPYRKNLKNVTGDTTETVKVTFGVERTRAKTFRKKTGISTTLSEEVRSTTRGSAGVKDVIGFNEELTATIKVSATFTKEFETTRSRSLKEKEGNEHTISVSFPRLPADAVQWSYWQEFVRIACYAYNSHGQLRVFGETLDYGNDDCVRLQKMADGSLEMEGHK